MEYRPLYVLVMGADDLKDVHEVSPMEPYVEVSLGGDPKTKYRTRADRYGRKNPRWNECCRLEIPARFLNNLSLDFDIKSSGLRGDMEVGRVTVPLTKLLNTSNAAAKREVEYPVCRPSGKEKGTLRFCFTFGNMIMKPYESEWPGQQPHQPKPSVLPTLIVAASAVFGGAIEMVRCCVGSAS